MRPSQAIAATLLVSLSLAASVPAQVTTATKPVGFNTITVPASGSAVVSSAFYQLPKFQGPNSAVGANSLTFTGTSFSTGGTLPTANAPYLARLLTGPSTGQFFLVTSYTDTQLTLDTRGYTLVTGSPANNTQVQVGVGDSVEICPANTLGTLFGTSTVPFQTGASASAADNVLLFNGTSWDVYYHNGTNWKKSGSLANQNGTVVLPDRGMFIVRRAASALPLTFLGAVPSTAEKTDFTGPASTFRSIRFPVDMIFRSTDPNVKNALNLQNLPGWQSGASASAADNVYVWNGTSWSVYFFNGTNWKKSGNLAIQDSTVIPLGTAMFVVRQSSAAGTNSTLTQQLPYSL